MIIAATSRAIMSLGSAAAKNGADEGADHAADDQRHATSLREVAHPVVRAGRERDDQHLQEERQRGGEARVDAQQQQARHQHAAVDADGRRDRPAANATRDAKKIVTARRSERR